MGQIRKIGNNYYIEFQARGLMYSQLAGTDALAAESLLTEIEAKIAQGEALTIVREIDLEAFIRQFELYLDDHFSLSSKKRILSLWRHWRDFLLKEYPAVNKLSQITPSMIEAYKTFLSRSYRAKLVNFSLLLLREVLEYGIRIGFINDNPSLHISLLRMPAKKIKESARTQIARDLLLRSVNLQKVCHLLKITDVARVMYWSNFFPLIREDVYNW